MADCYSNDEFQTKKEIEFFCCLTNPNRVKIQKVAISKKNFYPNNKKIRFPFLFEIRQYCNIGDLQVDMVLTMGVWNVVNCDINKELCHQIQLVWILRHYKNGWPERQWWSTFSSDCDLHQLSSFSNQM